MFHGMEEFRNFCELSINEDHQHWPIKEVSIVTYLSIDKRICTWSIYFNQKSINVQQELLLFNGTEPSYGHGILEMLWKYLPLIERIRFISVGHSLLDYFLQNLCKFPKLVGIFCITDASNVQFTNAFLNEAIKNQGRVSELIFNNTLPDLNAIPILKLHQTKWVEKMETLMSPYYIRRLAKRCQLVRLPKDLVVLMCKKYLSQMEDGGF
jgi:hypothetical protein